MSPDLSPLRADFEAALAATRTIADVKALRDQFLSRKHGRVTAALKDIPTLAPEARGPPRCRPSGR